MKNTLARLEHLGITAPRITVSDRDVDGVMAELEKQVSGSVADLAARFGSKARTRKALRREIRQAMEVQAETLARREVKRRVLEVFVSVAKETEGSDGVAGQRVSKELAGHLDSDLTDSHLASELIRQVVREYKIELDFERLSRAIEKLADEDARPRAARKRYYDDPELLFGVESAVLEEQVFEFLRNRISEVELEVDFTEFKSSVERSAGDNSPGAQALLPVIQISKANKCAYCPTSRCCQYVTQLIPTPKNKADFSVLLWQVSHEGVQIFKDSDGWQLLFESRCAHLQQDGRCGIYKTRPQVCREYTNDYCEFEGPAESDFELHFCSYDELLDYCRKRFKRWKDKANKAS